MAGYEVGDFLRDGEIVVVRIDGDYRVGRATLYAAGSVVVSVMQAVTVAVPGLPDPAVARVCDLRRASDSERVWLVENEKMTQAADADAGRLVKVGDVWVDPLVVEAVTSTYLDDDGVEHAGVHLWGVEGVYVAKGTTVDEAAATINGAARRMGER